MKQSFGEIKVLLARLSIALLTYPVCKAIFFLFNHIHFTDVSFIDFIGILFKGLRFDLSAVILINTPFILIHMIPLYFQTKWYQTLLRIVFIGSNSIAILADCFDIAYFKFTLKRTTADFFDLFGLGSDISSLLPQYLRDFWYIILLWLVITAILAYLYKLVPIPANPTENAKNNRGRVLSYILLNTLLIGLCIIGFRGGLQLRPLMPINASEYVSAKNIPLIVSTPFSIIKTYDQVTLENKNYYSEEELKNIFNPIQKNSLITTKANRSNIFIIILESFSKEYIGALSGKTTHTPFLDSLIKESIVFDNAFANGKKSLEGLPSVVAGIPGLMNEPFITSIYGTNNFNALAGILKEKKYSTAFFHGGTNGTMGFDAFSGSAGFENYYGKTEYNNESDYDGSWGIWDEEFFQFTVKKTSEMKQPFLSTLFSLSSHHPCAIPEKYKKQFPEGELPILKSVEYTDYSLRKFFESASKEKWFDSTLFVITADHTGPSNDNYYNNSVGMFRIPIIIYKHNGGEKGVNHRVTQHIDILPTVLNYLNYTEPYYAFGNNMMDSTGTGYAINLTSDVFQLIQGDKLLQFDGNRSIGFFNYKTDSLLQINLAGTEPDDVQNQMESKLKAIIQTYYNDMINNKMTAPQK